MLKREINATLSLLCLTFFIATLPLNAQPVDTLYEDSLCEYTWNSDINDCPDILECIYPDEWKDTVIDVPANITHISKDGLKLCLEDLELVKPADIIYIMDLSYSMYSTNGSNIIQYPDPGWQNVGDPYRIRDDALEAAFQFQIDSFPNSRAGYIGFGGDLIPNIGLPYSGYFSGTHLLPCVNVNTGQVQLNQIVSDLRNDLETDGRGTNFYAPLQRALQWIQDPSIMPDSVKAIIFISDGNISVGNLPSSPAFVSLLNQLNTLNVPIHGIYLGTSVGSDLTDIVTATGGTTTLVPPTDPSALGTVIKNIIKTLIKPFQPKGLTIRRNFPTPAFSTSAVSYQKIGDTAWAAVLDMPIPLYPGSNEIEVISVFGVPTPPPPDTVLQFKFYIDVGGDTTFTSECYYCWYRTQMDVFVNNVPVDTLTWQNNEYTIKLFYYGVDSLNQVDIIARTVQKGDVETITITNPTYDGEKYIFEKTVPFAVITGNATQQNGTTEADFEDLITFNWQHPDEPMDTAYTDVIVSAPPNRMEIHDKAGTPTAASKYATSPETDTITAGVLADLYAKVFANQKWLDVYETDPDLYKDISWAFVDEATGNPDPTIGTLGTASGVAHNTFFPIKAYHTIDLTATLTVAGLPPIFETIRLYIQPGEPKMLVIEATNDITQTQDLNNPCPWDPITMPGNINQLSAYAILRDSLGNWVAPASSESWDVLDANVVLVANGTGAGEGVITKGVDSAGQTIIWAWEGSMRDTSTVITLNYNIIDLEIVRIHIPDTDTFALDLLTMNQNQDTTLYTYGQRSDDSTWILVDTKWGMDPLATEANQNPPTAAKSWSFSPRIVASGIITASFIGLSDTVDYNFTVGPPLWVEFKIITHDSLLIAGQPIEGEVTIRNQDGLVPGLWEYPSIFTANPAYYIDIIDAGVPGTNGYIPYGKTADLLGAFLDSSFFDDSVSVSQKFFNGIDSLTFILYNTGSTVQSPEADPHQLTVYLDALSDATDPFILKPGPLFYIELTPDTLPPLTPDDPSFIIVAHGFDQFGNYLPNEIFAWSNDSSLFDFNINVNGTQIYIDPSDATDDQEGWVYVTGISDTNVQNKVYIIIIGPKPKLLLAVTDDLNGNGYLDLIRLAFDKPFALQPNYNLNNILIQKSPTENVFLTVDSMTIAPLSNNQKFYLHLNEVESIADGIPQSSWTPELTIDSLDSILPIIRVTCNDGAPPVVWKAVKDVKDIYDRKKDVVTITLSEKFYNADQSSFLSAGPTPVEVFNVWMKSDTTFLKIESMFTGINLFQDQKDDWTVFKMTNGENLNANHYININHLNTFVADNVSNIPYITNQKKQVAVTGPIGDINIAPVPINPSIHFFNQFNNIPLTPLEPLEIFDMINSQGGVMIQIDLMGNIEEAEATMMVFDVAANLVFKKGTDDNFIDELTQEKQLMLQQGAGNVQVCFYWSGCSSRGMKAAPGVYRILFWVVVKKPKESAGTTKYSKTVVVGRGIAGY